MGVPKSLKLGLPSLWSPITSRANLRSRCGLKQNYSFHWELFDGMSHALWRQVNRVDSWFFVVGNQIVSLTPGPSFGHNLCFTCPNEQCNPILTSTIQDLSNVIKKATIHWVLTPEIALWSFRSPPGLHLPKWELPWECEDSLLHIFLHSQEYVMWLSGFLLVRNVTTLFALVANPRWGCDNKLITYLVHVLLTTYYLLPSLLIN